MNWAKLAEEGDIREVAGYGFFWIERKKEERFEASIGFAIKTPQFVSKLSGLPKGMHACMAASGY